MAYVNPFILGVKGLVPERIDQGVDFSGDGPVSAIGSAKILDATTSAGWPGGGWVSYQLLDGPAAGRDVFVAEDITPTVSPGQTVAAGQQIATMRSGSSGIETGWASPRGSHLTLAQDYGGYSEGDHTASGDNFDQLLVSLGVPRSPGLGSPNRGALPPGFPSWGGNVPGSAGTTIPAGLNIPGIGGVGSSVLQSLLSLFGIGDIKDFSERAGLILFGAGLIVAGILIATKSSGQAKETIKEQFSPSEGSKSEPKSETSMPQGEEMA